MVMGRMWFFAPEVAVECPTSRAADAAAPRANRPGFSAKNHAPAKAVRRRRRAADAIVGRWWWEEGPRSFVHIAALKRARGVEEKQARPLAKGRGPFPDEGHVGRRRLRRRLGHLAGPSPALAKPGPWRAVSGRTGRRRGQGMPRCWPGRGRVARWPAPGLGLATTGRRLAGRRARWRAVPRWALPPLGATPSQGRGRQRRG